MANEELFDRLQQLVLKLDQAGVEATTREALATGLSPQDIISKGLAPGMELVGQGYEKGELFVPELMLSARATLAALDLLRPHLAGQGMGPPGKVVLGTVQGDIHDIGKNIVCTLLENHGFEVIDLGKNVSAARILAAAVEHAVDAVGLSALMTTTLQQMEVTLNRLRDAGVKVFTLVGGAVVSQEYADSIGADVYARDALEAVAKVKALFETGPGD